MHTWHFQSTGKGTFSDPLRRLGTAAADTHPPAVIFATPDGECAHRIARMAVLDARFFEKTCRAVMEKNRKFRPKKMPKEGESSADKNDLADYRRAEKLLEKGDRDGARKHLLAIVDRGEPRPLAARAAILLDEKGPFPRVWETRARDDADPLAESTEVGPGKDGPVNAAVDFLLGQQDPDGSWPEPTRRYSLPVRKESDRGVLVPRTALCVDALRHWRDGMRGERRRRADDAIARGSKYVFEWTADPAPKVWHLTYALHLELTVHPERRGAEKRAAARRIQGLIGKLGEIEHDGGWTYTRTTRLHTFNTAPILILLAEARAQGFDVKDAQLDRAAAFLERNRLGKKSLFHYGTEMEHMAPAARPAKARLSSCFRSPLCELALHLSGKGGGEKRLRESLEVFFDGLEAARSTAKIYESYVDPSCMQDSYRYFFGVWYAARAIRALPEKRQKRLADRLRETIPPLMELDGSYADSLMVGRTSSTALALLALAELR
jgi:hypothetical protein